MTDYCSNCLSSVNRSQEHSWRRNLVLFLVDSYIPARQWTDICNTRCSILSSFSHFHVSHFPPLHSGAAFSCPTISCLAFSASPLSCLAGGVNGALQRLANVSASTYRSIGRYRRSEYKKLMIFLKLVADTPLRQLTPTQH